jgi:DNA-binding transcriptional regulator GbsR (MarR family)
MQADQRSEFVERFARLLEEGGRSRIAGRIYAHLATAPEPYLSQQEIADQLGVSSGSVSTNTRALMSMNLLTRVAVPGSRRDYYALVPDGAWVTLHAAADNARRAVALAEEGLSLQPDLVTTGTQSLRAMRQVYGQLATTIDALIAESVRKAQ